MAKWRIELDSDSADAIADLGRVIEKERELAKQSRQTGEALERQAKKTDQVSNATKRKSKELSGVGRILTSLKDQVVGYVASWVGLNAVQSALRAHIERLEKIRELQNQIVETAQGTANQAAGAAVQIFGAAGTRNVDRAISLAQRVAGPSGSTLAQGINFARAGDLAFGGLIDSSGNVNQAAIASTVAAAQVAQALDLTGAADQQAFFEILKQNQATTPKQVRAVSARLQAGFRSSEAPNFGAFASGLVRSGLPALLAGGLSLEDAISLNVRARAITTGEQAPGFARTFFQAATGIRGGEKGRAFLGQQAAARGLDFAGMTGQQKVELFSAITRQEISAGRTAELGELFGGTEVVQSLAIAQRTASNAASAFGASLAKTLPTFDALVVASNNSTSASNRRIQADVEVAEFEEGRQARRVALAQTFKRISEAEILRGFERDHFANREIVTERLVLKRLRREFGALRTDDPAVQAQIAAAQADVRGQQGKVEIGPPGSEFAPGPLPPSGILFRTGASDSVIQRLVETLVEIRDHLAGQTAQGGPAQLNPSR